MKSPKVTVAIVLAGVLVAWAVFSSSGGTLSSLLSPIHGNPSLVRPVATTDHIFGNPAAPVMIVVYCDFVSSYCQGFSDTMHELIANDGANGQIAWVAREFPLQETSGNALADARAAECAAKVGSNDAFWSFADLLYADQPVDPSQYGDLAKQAGLAGSDFATCYADASSEVDARIKVDRQNALDVGATGTPYSLLIEKGHAPVVIDGAYTYDALRTVVDKALGNS